MGKDFETSETGNWNVADKWSEIMIFKSLYETSENLKIAMFGCSDLMEDFTFDENTKTTARIKALKWAKYSLEQSIKNSLFAIKNEPDKKKLREYLKDLVELNLFMDKIEDKKRMGDKIKIEINTDIFNFVFDMLSKVFMEITEPMNKSDLIFTHKETFNAKDFKKKIIDDFVEEG